MLTSSLNVTHTEKERIIRIEPEIIVVKKRKEPFTQRLSGVDPEILSPCGKYLLIEFHFFNFRRIEEICSTSP